MKPWLHADQAQQRNVYRTLEAEPVLGGTDTQFIAIKPHSRHKKCMLQDRDGNESLKMMVDRGKNQEPSTKTLHGEQAQESPPL